MTGQQRDYAITCEECGPLLIAIASKQEWLAHMAAEHPGTTLDDWEFSVPHEYTILDLVGPIRSSARLIANH